MYTITSAAVVQNFRFFSEAVCRMPQKNLKLFSLRVTKFPETLWSLFRVTCAAVVQNFHFFSEAVREMPHKILKLSCEAYSYVVQNFPNHYFLQDSTKFPFDFNSICRPRNKLKLVSFYLPPGDIFSKIITIYRILRVNIIPKFKGLNTFYYTYESF